MIDKYNATLITYTPLHIGSGEEITPFEYIVEAEDKLSVYPYDYLLNKISEVLKGEALLSCMSYLKVKAKTGQFDTLSEFLERFKLSEKIEPKYKVFLNSHELGSSVKAFIKNLQGPYIPGSEIKGALRTAFFYGVIKNDPELKKKFFDTVSSYLKKAKQMVNKRKSEQLKEFEKGLNEIEKLVFRASKKDEAQFDLFKALHISDSEPIPYDYFYVDKILLLNSDKPTDFCELLDEGKKISISVKIDNNSLSGLEKCKDFSRDYEVLQLGLLNWDKLKEYSCEFYKDLILCEKEFVENSRLMEEETRGLFLSHLNKILEQIERCKSSKVLVFPLRIGRYQGFLSTTLMLLAKREKVDLFEEVFRFCAPRVSGVVNKTRRAITKKDKLYTLGWCFLHIRNADQV